MSAVLGHIHHWLYKKIQLINEREKLIEDKSRTVINDLADELHAISLDTYGPLIDPAIPLEDIIDHDNIHMWLQNQITTSSVREASFIKDLLDSTSGDQAVPTITAILDAFAVQGSACGHIAAEQLQADNPENLYNMLQNFYVNGMPCDGGDDIIINSDTQFTWIGNHKHQMTYWKKAGVDPNFMALAYQTWFDFFIRAASPTCHFIVLKQDNEIPHYTIQKD